MRAPIDFRIRPPARDSERDERVRLAAEMRRYQELYGMEELSNLTFAELVDDMERHSVRGIMQAEYESGDPGAWNRRVAELIGRRPDLFLGGIATTDPRSPGALGELERAHDELGLRGMVIQPGFLGVEATDPRCMPLYELCQERGVPVTVHTGVNFSRTGSIAYGRPLAIDRVACSFPDLTLVCNHGGWPWVGEAIAIAWKHRNVYLEFGAVAPKYMADPRGGWQPLPHWMSTQLRSKVVLGTDWPMLRYERLLDEVHLLGLADEALDAYLGGNALRIIERSWGGS